MKEVFQGGNRFLWATPSGCALILDIDKGAETITDWSLAIARTPQTCRAVFSAIPGEHAYNPIGMVHGGYAATLLDSACGFAVHSRLSATQGYTTLDLNVSYLRPITKDRTQPYRRCH